MSNPIVTVEGLSKSYRGRKVLDNISFSLQEGEILGLFGPNGAGKSVLIRLLATLEKADSGKIVICGHDLSQKNNQIRRLICLVSDMLQLEDELTVVDCLHFLLSAYSVKKQRKSAMLEYLLEKTGLKNNGVCRIQDLSAGFKQRLRLALTYLPHFKLFLLDEPFKDLDIWIKKKLMHHLREMANQGNSILLASHFIDDLKGVSHRLAILKEGRFDNIVSL